MSGAPGELDEATLTEMIKQPDVRAVIDLLATWEIVYARPLTKHFREFSEKGDLAILECALDRYYYEDALEMVRTPSYNNALIRDILGTEIDVVNIRTILRMIRDHVKEDIALEFLIEGGKELNVKDLMHLLTLHSVNEAVPGAGIDSV